MPKQPLTPFGESLRTAWEVFQDHFKTIFLVIVFVNFPLNILVDLTTIRNLDWDYMIRQPWQEWNYLIFLNFGLVCLSVLFGMLVNAAIIITTHRALKHEVTSPGQALGMAVSYWPKILVTMICSELLMTAGFFLLLVPGLFLAWIFFFGVYAVVLGNVWGVKALFYSARLILKHPWVSLMRILGVLLLVLIPSFAVISSSGQIDLYGIPAVGETIIDVIVAFSTVYFTLFFLELEQQKPDHV